MNGLLNSVKECSENLNILSLKENIVSLENFVANNNIDIVILGQFKAGKSSFINHLIGKEILPTGVIPVTSVITRLQFGETEKAIVSDLNTNKTELAINLIDEFIAENKNPKNEKNVSVIDLELPYLKHFQNVRLIDTPGIGSVFRHNTQTTENWFSEIGIALITISAERPLGENEMILIREISNFTPEIIILITKVDLHTEEQIGEVKEYVESQLQKEFNRKFKIFDYSIIKNSETSKQIILNEVFHPILSDLKDKHNKIAQYKLNSLAKSCLTYVDIAYQSSLKSDKEKEHLKKIIFDEKLNTNFIQQELNLIAESSKSQLREEIYKILTKYEANLVSELCALFHTEYASWKGNLFKLSRKYEEWMRNTLSVKLKEIAEKEQDEFINIIKGVNAHFSFFTKSFRSKLSENIYKVLGIKLADEEWKPELKAVKQPDISVYRAFDTPIDLLWFLFPMFIFKNIFGHYFSKQIAKEVSKNIYRLTSGIFQIISGKIDSGKDQTLKYILSELETVEKVLSGNQSNSDEYQLILKKLKQELNNVSN